MALQGDARMRVVENVGRADVSPEERQQLLGSVSQAQTWEYRVLSPPSISDLEHQLNELGVQGFDLVGVATAFRQSHGREVPFLVLKRPKSA
jgi:hypothetical protein